MTFDEVRTRLAVLEGRTYWRSLEELADTPDFHEYVSREFPAQASEFTDPAGRRQHSCSASSFSEAASIGV